MSEIRYRRSSLKTLLGITAEKKRHKRELGITAILRPFRWWGNEKRDVKREVGYYSPEMKLARHVLPHHTLAKLAAGALLVIGIPFVLGWLLSAAARDTATREAAPPAASQPTASQPATTGPAAQTAPTTAQRAQDELR